MYGNVAVFHYVIFRHNLSCSADSATQKDKQCNTIQRVYYEFTFFIVEVPNLLIVKTRIFSVNSKVGFALRFYRIVKVNS